MKLLRLDQFYNMSVQETAPMRQEQRPVKLWAEWYLLSKSHSHLQDKGTLRKKQHHLGSLVQKPQTRFGDQSRVQTTKLNS